MSIPTSGCLDNDMSVNLHANAKYARLNETEVRLPGSQRHVFQSDKLKATEVDITRGRHVPVRTLRNGSRVLEEGNASVSSELIANAIRPPSRNDEPSWRSPSPA